MKKILSIACSVSFLLTSCATILSGRYQKVTINSEPPNADLYLEGNRIGTTGTQISIRKKYANYREFTIKKEGYADTTWKAAGTLEPTFYIGVLPPAFGIPCFIDIIAETAIKIKEPVQTVKLKPNKN
jgi:hypothetical protein